MTKMSPAPDHVNEFEHDRASKLYFLPLVAVAAMVIFLVFFWKGERELPPEGANHPSVGAPLIGLTLTPLDDNDDPLSIDDVKGKATLINYWGPWCYYCLLEMPHLKELNDKLANEPDYQFISVTCDQGATQNLDALHEQSLEKMRELEVDWPLYADPDQSSRVALAHSAMMNRGFGFPTTVLLDREGKIAGLWEGYADGIVTDMERAVRATLNE